MATIAEQNFVADRDASRMDRDMTFARTGEEAGYARLAGWAVTGAMSIIFLWFGCLKFTDYEASGVAGFIINSPLVGWVNGLFGTAGGPHFIGVFEIVTGVLIAARLVSPRLSAIGGAMGVFTFLMTLSFMFSTPGVIQGGFSGPFALSAVPGQFLLKDLGLLTACLWILATSLDELRARNRAS